MTNRLVLLWSSLIFLGLSCRKVQNHRNDKITTNDAKNIAGFLAPTVTEKRSSKVIETNTIASKVIETNTIADEESPVSTGVFTESNVISNNSIALNQTIDPIVTNQSNIVPVTISNFNNQTMLMAVTICKPNDATNCMTINNIWMDTGSVGLTIFSDISSLNLPEVTDPSGRTLADCSNYGFGASAWGPLVRADISLGTNAGALKATNFVMRQLSSTYAGSIVDRSSNSYCGGRVGATRTSPIRFYNYKTSSMDQINGIIGLTADINDCYSQSDDIRTCGNYSVCSGTGSAATCQGIGSANEPSPITTGLSNPIAGLPTPYNNGFILQIPDIPLGGAMTIENASMILGIGNASNNKPPADLTVLASLYDGTLIGFDNSKICPLNGSCSNNFDTGNFANNLPGDVSPQIYFTTPLGPYYGFSTLYVGSTTPPSTIPCSSGSDYFQADNVSVTATLTGVDHKASKTISIPITNGVPVVCNWMTPSLNAPYLFKNITNVMTNPTQVFLGMPFFYGRTLYFGMPGKQTVIGGVTYTGSFLGL